jgi:hypothetical protein
MSGGFNEHKVMLFLDAELYTAFIKVQADKGLGRSYAGLLPYVEGLYQMGYLSKETYEKHAQRYSEPLIKKAPDAPPSAEALEIEKVSKIIEEMIRQFHDHKDNVSWLRSANLYAERFTRLAPAVVLRDMIKAATVTVPATVTVAPTVTVESSAYSPENSPVEGAEVTQPPGGQAVPTATTQKNKSKAVTVAAPGLTIQEVKDKVAAQLATVFQEEKLLTQIMGLGYSQNEAQKRVDHFKQKEQIVKDDVGGWHFA